MHVNHESFAAVETCLSLGAAGSGHRPLVGTLWHGTRLELLPDILAEGLIPARTQVGHTCLTRDPETALFYARLAQSLMPGHPGTEPVLIRIDASSLSPDQIVPETGSADISAYGKGQPGRGARDLALIRSDWHGLFEATGCLGFSDVIPVCPEMVEYRFARLPRLGIDEIRLESTTGVPASQTTRSLCRALRQEHALLPVAA